MCNNIIIVQCGCGSHKPRRNRKPRKRRKPQLHNKREPELQWAEDAMNGTLKIAEKSVANLCMTVKALFVQRRLESVTQ